MIAGEGNDKYAYIVQYLGELSDKQIIIPDTLNFEEFKNIKVKYIGAQSFMDFNQTTNIEIQSNPIFPARIAFCVGPVGEEIEFFDEK